MTGKLAVFLSHKSVPTHTHARTHTLPHPRPHMCGGEMKGGNRKEGQPAASSVLRSPQGKQSGC